MNPVQEDDAFIEAPPLTAADAYNYWATLAYYGHDYDGTEIDVTEATANAIAWASRDPTEVLTGYRLKIWFWSATDYAACPQMR